MFLLRVTITNSFSIEELSLEEVSSIVPFSLPMMMVITNTIVPTIYHALTIYHLARHWLSTIQTNSVNLYSPSFKREIMILAEN